MSSPGRKRIGVHSAVQVIAVAALALSLICPASAATGFPFRVKRHVALAVKGEVSGLAFRPDGTVAYAAVGHAIEALGAGSGSLLGKQSTKGRVVGVAVSPDGKDVYAATRDPSRWLVLNAATLKVMRNTALHVNAPDQLYYDATTRSAYVAGASSHEVVRLAPGSGKVLAKAHLDGPVGQIVSNGRGRLYAAVEHSAGVEAIDARSMQLLGRLAAPGCSLSGALALDPVGRRLFIGCASGRTDIMDADLGFVFKRLLLSGIGAVRSVFAFHPAPGSGWKGGAFAMAGRQIDAVKMDAFVRYGNGGHIDLPGEVRALALSPHAHELWVAIGLRSGISEAVHAADHDGKDTILVLAGPSGDHP